MPAALGVALGNRPPGTWRQPAHAGARIWKLRCVADPTGADRRRARSEEGRAGPAPAGGEAARGSSISQAGERRLSSIESLRALAAIGVLSAHIWGAAGGNFFEGFGNRVLSGLGFGALFFFALSGALLYVPFARRDFGGGGGGGDGGGGVSIRHYALNRALRIFPLYYVALVVSLLALEHGGTLKQWFMFTLFLENFSTQTAGTVNGALWTIVVELHFYILLPFIALLIAALARGSWRRGAVVLGALIAISALATLVFVLLPVKPYRDPLRFSLPMTFFLIGSGMMVALLREAWSERPRLLRGPLASADVWLLAAIPFWLLFVYHYQLQPLFAISCFLILGAFMLPLRPSRVGRLLAWRPLATLGLASYSLYIWQVPIIIAVHQYEIPVLDRLIHEAQSLIGSDFVGLFVVLAPICIAVALLSFKLIEEPALRLRKRWGGFAGQRDRRRKPAPAPAPAGEPAPSGQAPAGEPVASPGGGTS